MRIGIDLGGTKIEGIALDSSGEEWARIRVSTPKDYPSTLNAIRHLVNDLVTKSGATNYTVGVGTPGAISPATGLMKNANSTFLIGKPMDRDLSEILQQEVRMANDANCFALSEAVDGAAEKQPVVFGVILGTGVGGGLVINGELLVGAHAIAGEWGHNPLPWMNEAESPGPKCYCGKQGCIEAFLSGPGMVARYQQGVESADVGVTSPKHIAGRAASGDLQAEEYLQKYEDRLARALSGVINVVDPHVIVLGGGVSNLDRLYSRVPELLEKYVFSDEVHTKLVPAKFGDSSGVRGAAWLWPKPL